MNKTLKEAASGLAHPVFRILFIILILIR